MIIMEKIIPEGILLRKVDRYIDLTFVYDCEMIIIYIFFVYTYPVGVYNINRRYHGERR